jgi:hypothetical protein
MFFPRKKRFYKEDLKSKYEINKEKIDLSTEISNNNKNKNNNNQRNLQNSNSNTITQNEYFNLENQVPLVQKLTIKPERNAHEIYQISLPIEKNSTIIFKLSCKNTDENTNSINPYNILEFSNIESANILYNKLSNFLNQKNLILRKASLTNNNTLIKNTIQDFAYLNTKIFDNFFINKNIQISQNDTEINGFTIIFILENDLNIKTYFNNFCSILPSNNSNNENLNFPFEKIQENSEKINGYFKLKIIEKNEYLKEIIHISENIPVYNNDLEYYFKTIEFINDKIQVLKNFHNDSHAIYYIRLDLKVIFNIYFLKYFM